MKNFTFILVLITITLLTTIGLIFIYGTGYSYYSSIKSPNWTETPPYQDYLGKMNSATLPFVIALVVTLGLCIPKRLFSGQTLLIVTGILLSLTLILAAISGGKIALGFLLVTGMIIQLVVLTLTFLGSKSLSFEKSGFFLQVGSVFLHLGLLIFLFDFILLPEASYHLDLFWFSTALIGLGMLFSFYSKEISRALRREE